MRAHPRNFPRAHLAALSLLSLLTACAPKGGGVASGAAGEPLPSPEPAADEGQEPAPFDPALWPGLDLAPHLAPEGGWTTEAQGAHPLVGAIWDVQAGAFLSEAELLERAGQRPFVLLGEKHDNPDHHRLQARLIAALAGPSTPVVFEMLDDGDLDAVAASEDSAALAEAVDWAGSGWPDFTMYAPVFDAVYAAGGRVVVGHPSRATLKGAMMQGLESVPEGELRDLQLERGDTPEVNALYAEEIRESHCGYATEEIVPPMVLGQRLKDAWMARALRDAAASAMTVRAPALLVAGGGHVRPDRAAPLYLSESYSVTFVEVPRGGGALDPAELVGAADAVWFTPRVDELDPCEVFLEQLEKMGPVE
ncbi:MAG: ChaN family lipoprotein [Alphaproteobacteria bacterium]|nr:ChaN family lipoprotein [Alphaproteobacteria bacterium]